MEIINQNPPTKRTKPARKPSKPFRAKQERAASNLRTNVIDLDKVKAWAEVGCTETEIAGLLRVSPTWLSNAIKESFELEQAIISGQSDMKCSLRSAQVRLALTGHAGMLIWLGKQFLGQSDKQEVKNETTVNVTLQQAMKEMRELPREDVLMIRGIIEAQNETGAPEDAPAEKAKRD